MKSDHNWLVAAFMVVVLMGASLGTCFWPSDDSEEGFSVSGSVIGLSSYNQPKTDMVAEDLFDHGAELGATFTITTEGGVYHDAILFEEYQGIFMYDIFVNIETDGYVSIGCVGELITADEGSEITLTYTGTSERYQKETQYTKGYTDVRSDYPSDEVFANFYEVTGGDLKDDILYRSFSSLYAPEKQSRSTYVNDLAEEAGIQYLIALSYNDKSVKDATDRLDGHCITLCKEGKYVAPSMGYLYIQQKEKTKLVMESILDNDGAYLVHCNVGRDRTGFVILLLQALCNCTPDEMKECEAAAFCNLYNIDVGSKEYETVVDCTYTRNMYFIAYPEKISDVFEIDWDTVNVDSVDTYSAAYSFCTDYLGLTDEEVSGIQQKLCG